MTNREQILSAIVAKLQSSPALQGVPIHCPSLSSFTCKVQGQSWPETLGDLALMGPANRLGSWRWYQRRSESDGTQATWRIKVNHRLQPIWESVVTADD
jgi:hypothetical protein